jgi:ELWxxDGT repeat protein
VLFWPNDGTTGQELWSSDGTAAGTVLVKDINPGPGHASDLLPLFPVDGAVFFSADDGSTGNELWKSDGTTKGTVLIKDITPGSAGSHPWGLANVSGTLFFTADDGTTGRELWKSDGTAAGTSRLADINPGVASSDIKKWVTPVIIFRQYIPHVFLPQPQPDVNPRAAYFPWWRFFVERLRALVVSEERLFFAGNDGTHGRELWMLVLK